ncbi:MAG: BRCT domain-containing protein [Clostridiales Family XIII bacterium]|nr:BRCT domain-containing protein [Clostridiales Family XIII bacterium]
MSENEQDIPENFLEKLRSILFIFTENNEISEEEEEILFDVFNKILNPTDEINPNDIIFQNKNFVLTGNFNAGKRKKVEILIQKKGGNVKKGVTKNVDYVIIGGLGNRSYVNGTYGTKVKKAMELGVKVIKETDAFPEK